MVPYATRSHKGAHNDLTAQYVKSILDYNPITGEFRWKWRHDVKPNINSRTAGKPAGAPRKIPPRIKIGINGVEYMAHRLAWLIMTGSWPTYEIDHIDLNPFNNRWGNLREATPSQNQSNRPLRSHNKSGFTGVCFDNRQKDWIASINTRHIGHYPTIEQAIAARVEAVQRVHQNFAHAQSLRSSTEINTKAPEE